MKAYGVRSYIPEKNRRDGGTGGQTGEQQAVYANAAGAGEYGKSLLRRRGELVERSFAHCYETANAALPSADRKTFGSGTDPRGRVQSKLILRQLLGRHAAEWKNVRQTCFDPLLTLTCR